MFQGNFRAPISTGLEKGIKVLDVGYVQAYMYNHEQDSEY